MINAIEVAKYIINSLSVDNLKLQKLLYYSQAVHLVLNNKAPLFTDEIEAWDYGPVVPPVYREYKPHDFNLIPTVSYQTKLASELKSSIDIAIRLYGGMSGTELIDQTHYESPWKKAYRPGRPSKIISIDSIYEYFEGIISIREVPANIPTKETIKTRFFENLKESVDQLIPQNEDISYSENPFVDVEAIAKKCGITSIKNVPKNNILDKHALLIGTEIYISNQDNQEKQRFSIAHEIFHFLTRWPGSDLIQAVARQGETWKKKKAGTAEAIEEEITDYFAANLLIPTERFILWEDKTDEEIARAFGVEEKCVRKRREEIDHELDLMAPKNLSSGVNLEEMTPLSFDDLDCIPEGHRIHDTGWT